MVNWQEKGTIERLLAAIIAAQDNKINCREVARLFGDGATYDAIENYLRKPKKQALVLKKDAASYDDPAPSTPRSTRKKALISPTKTSAKGTRVSKPKKAVASKVKTELLEEDAMLFDNTVNGALGGEVEEEV